MNEAIRMQISAFVDGELPENESELLLRRLSQDAVMRQQVAEYLKIGRLLRRELEVAGMTGLRGKIAEALGEEAAQESVEVEQSPSKYLKPAAGFAIAASVAVLAVLGLRQVNLPESQLDSVAEQSDANSIGITQPTASETMPDELRQMYQRHGTTSSTGNFSRLVTLEYREGEFVQVEPHEDILSDEPADEEQSDDDADTARDSTASPQ